MRTPVLSEAVYQFAARLLEDDAVQRIGMSEDGGMFVKLYEHFHRNKKKARS